MKRKQYVSLMVLAIISVVFVGCGENYSEELDQLNAEVAGLKADLDELQKASANADTVLAEGYFLNVDSIKVLQTELDDIQTAIDDSYNAGELDEIWISIEEIQTELDTIKSGMGEIPDTEGNAGGASVSIEIIETGKDGAEWEQNYSEFLGGWSDLVQVWYTIRNTGSIDIDYYEIWFTATCSDGTTYEDWTNGSNLDTGHSITDSTFINIPGKEVTSIEMTDYELTVR